MEPNPELDETTAVALCIAISNHIEALKMWQRKLTIPFVPTTTQHYRLTPQYEKPTLTTALHVLESCSHARMELGRTMQAFTKAKNLENV